MCVRPRQGLRARAQPRWAKGGDGAPRYLQVQGDPKPGAHHLRQMPLPDPKSKPATAHPVRSLRGQWTLSAPNPERGAWGSRCTRSPGTNGSVPGSKSCKRGPKWRRSESQLFHAKGGRGGGAPRSGPLGRAEPEPAGRASAPGPPKALGNGAGSLGGGGGGG